MSLNSTDAKKCLTTLAKAIIITQNMSIVKLKHLKLCSLFHPQLGSSGVSYSHSLIVLVLFYLNTTPLMILIMGETECRVLIFFK